ncbi:hypothetical protein [Methylobacterium terricola]|uniref:hypothetical protein n=1 Tax=Methylobacterium terricola TaxID=2583531 RepID=UPI0026CEA818
MKRLIGMALAVGCLARPAMADDLSLWSLYDRMLRSAKYIDLTHAFAPVQPVWPGFAGARFKPA